LDTGGYVFDHPVVVHEVLKKGAEHVLLPLARGSPLSATIGVGGLDGVDIAHDEERVDMPRDANADAVLVLHEGRPRGPVYREDKNDAQRLLALERVGRVDRHLEMDPRQSQIELRHVGPIGRDDDDVGGLEPRRYEALGELDA
jgi:hypothetical protein